MDETELTGKYPEKDSGVKMRKFGEENGDLGVSCPGFGVKTRDLDRKKNCRWKPHII